MTDPRLIDSVALLGSGGALAAAVLSGRWRSARWQASQYEAAVLQFPRDLDPNAVSAFMTSLAGTLPQRCRRLLTPPIIIFETTADQSGIEFRLIVPASLEAFVFGQLRVALPGIRITPKKPEPMSPLTAATELRLNTDSRPLRVDGAAASAAAVLASLQPLDTGERVVVQWLVSPAGPTQQIKRAAAASSGPVAMVENLATVIRDSEELQAARAKQSSALFRATIRLGVEAPTPQRSRQLLVRLLGPWHVFNAPGVHLRQRLLPPSFVARQIFRRLPNPFVLPSLFNAVELTALVGWPLGGPLLQGLWLGTARQLPVAPEIPTTGLVLARSNFASSNRAIAVSIEDSRKHLVVTGGTGSGKSTLLGNLAVQAMAAGHGLIVIEPHGDLVNDVLDSVPQQRERDVIVLSATDDRVVGLNPLSASHGDAELAVEQIVSLLHQLFSAFWGPRSDDIARAAILTLAISRPQMTLVELPRLLTDESFRAPLVATIQDRGLRAWWAWFEQLSPGERTVVVAPVINKIRAFVGRSRLRAIVGQAEGIDLDQILAERKILLVPLPTGALGQDAAALLGSLVVAMTWQATLRRASLPANQRHPVMFVIDEMQRFLNLPTDISDVLAEARKLGLGLVLATQSLSLLPPALRRGVLANARTKVAFAAAADDAALLAREFEPSLSADDLRHLGPYEVAIQVAVASTVAPPTTGVALPPAAPTNRGTAARAWSRETFGRPIAEVEAAIEARQQLEEPNTQVRRRKRGDA